MSNRYLKIAFRHWVDTYETKQLTELELNPVFSKKEAINAIQNLAQSKDAIVGGFMHDKEDDDYTCMLWKSYRWYDVSDYPSDYDAERILDGVPLTDPLGGKDIDETIRFFKQLPEGAIASPFPQPYDPSWDKDFDDN